MVPEHGRRRQNAAHRLRKLRDAPHEFLEHGSKQRQREGRHVGQGRRLQRRRLPRRPLRRLEPGSRRRAYEDCLGVEQLRDKPDLREERHQGPDGLRRGHVLGRGGRPRRGRRHRRDGSGEQEPLLQLVRERLRGEPRPAGRRPVGADRDPHIGSSAVPVSAPTAPPTTPPSSLPTSVPTTLPSPVPRCRPQPCRAGTPASKPRGARRCRPRRCRRASRRRSVLGADGAADAHTRRSRRRRGRRRPSVGCSAGVTFSTEHDVEASRRYLNIHVVDGRKSRRPSTPSARRRGTVDLHTGRRHRQGRPHGPACG